MLDTLYIQIGAIVWLAVCAFAILKGDQPERLGGAALLVGWVATLIIHRAINFSGMPYPVMIVDALLLAALIALSWKSDRSWPVWASGFQLIVVLVHLVTLIDLRIRIVAYLSAQTVATYGVLICLAVGTFWAWQEREAIRPRD